MEAPRFLVVLAILLVAYGGTGKWISQMIAMKNIHVHMSNGDSVVIFIISSDFFLIIVS